MGEPLEKQIFDALPGPYTDDEGHRYVLEVDAYSTDTGISVLASLTDTWPFYNDRHPAFGENSEIASGRFHDTSEAALQWILDRLVFETHDLDQNPPQPFWTAEEQTRYGVDPCTDPECCEPVNTKET